MTHNTTITAAIANLTNPARDALLSVGTRRQGATPRRTSAEVMAELTAAGMLGKNGGLTRRGSIAYEIVSEEAMAW